MTTFDPELKNYNGGMLANQNYQKVLVDLYERVLVEVRKCKNWKSGDSRHDLERALRHQHKAEALLDLLEDVTVGQTGEGVKSSSRSFQDRVNSFFMLKESKNHAD
jgi:hypothetical protein